MVEIFMKKNLFPSDEMSKIKMVLTDKNKNLNEHFIII